MKITFLALAFTVFTFCGCGKTESSKNSDPAGNTETNESESRFVVKDEESETITSEAELVKWAHKALVACDARALGDLYSREIGMGVKVQESVKACQDPSNHEVREGFAKEFGIEAEKLKSIYFTDMIALIITKELIDRRKGLKAAAKDFGEFVKLEATENESEKEEAMGSFYRAAHPNGAQAEIAVARNKDGTFGLTLLEIDNWPDK